jgi:peroxiredoxin
MSFVAQNWKTKKELQYTLLSDPSRKLLKALGATEAKK